MHYTEYFSKGEPNFNYNYCEKKFIQKRNLTAHLPSHNGTVWKRKYPNCPKKATDKRYLNSHYRTHTEKLRYPCPKCDQCFKFYEQKRRHLAKRSLNLWFFYLILNVETVVRTNLFICWTHLFGIKYLRHWVKLFNCWKAQNWYWGSMIEFCILLIWTSCRLHVET